MVLANRGSQKGRGLPEGATWELQEDSCQRIMGHLLLEQVASLGLEDIGWAQSWQRQSLPLNVTRSPGGNGRLETERYTPPDYSSNFISFPYSFWLLPSGTNLFLGGASTEMSEMQPRPSQPSGSGTNKQTNMPHYGEKECTGSIAT